MHRRYYVLIVIEPFPVFVCDLRGQLTVRLHLPVDVRLVEIVRLVKCTNEDGVQYFGPPIRRILLVSDLSRKGVQDGTEPAATAGSLFIHRLFGERLLDDPVEVKEVHGRDGPFEDRSIAQIGDGDLR
jgi:hypothetical protein